METNLAYQDEMQYELIGGRLTAMSPPPNINHIQISANIYRIFANYLRGKECRPFPDGTGLYLSEEERFRPDFMVVCDRSRIKAAGVYGAPDLVVEVGSPSTIGRDRGHKMRAYERSGVREYWLVSPGEYNIEVYLLKDGRFQLDNVYSVYHDYDTYDMTEEERAAIVTEFKCSLYDDLVIRLEDVFYDLIELV